MAAVKNCGYETDRESIALEREREQREFKWIEQDVLNGLRMWHVIFLSTAAVLSVIILLCCCIKFRIPRTKQEIEGDYVRRKILRKFRRKLKGIQNQELDDMDLKKALDKIRAEFKSDNESLIHSDAGFSIGSFSPSGRKPRHFSSAHPRASELAIDISLEDLRAQSLGVGARVMLAVNRFFGRSNVSKAKCPENSGTATAISAPGKPSSSQTCDKPVVKTKSEPPPPQPKSKSPQQQSDISVIPQKKGSTTAPTNAKSGKLVEKSAPVSVKSSTGIKLSNEKPTKVEKVKKGTDSDPKKIIQIPKEKLIEKSQPKNKNDKATKK